MCRKGSNGNTRDHGQPTALPNTKALEADSTSKFSLLPTIAADGTPKSLAAISTLSTTQQPKARPEMDSSTARIQALLCGLYARATHAYASISVAGLCQGTVGERRAASAA